MKRYISIDIGGTAIKYGIIGEDAKIMLQEYAYLLLEW